MSAAGKQNYQRLRLNWLKHVIAELRPRRVVDSGLQVIQDDRQRLDEGLFIGRKVRMGYH